MFVFLFEIIPEGRKLCNSSFFFLFAHLSVVFSCCFIFIFLNVLFLGSTYCYLSSRYAGARWSLRKPEFRVNLGAQVLGTALNSLRFGSC
jgi:hypothetical protein